MPIFQYKALNEEGKTTTGVTDADSPREARIKLKAKKLYVTDIDVVADQASRRKRSLLPDFFRRRRVRELSIITRQLATLLGSGIPLMGSMTAIIDQAEDKRLKSALMDIRERVAQGSSLAEAMKLHPFYFNDLYINMVAAGEASGTLDNVLHKMADYLQTQNRIQGKIAAALTYPMIMLCVGVIVVIVLLTFVVPAIMEFLQKQKQALPLPTVILLAVSDFLRMFWWVFVIGLFVLIGVYRGMLRTEKGRLAIDTMKLNIPLLGNLFRKQAISRFAITFSTLLQSGLPVLEALRIVKNVVNNQLLANTLEMVRQKIAEGADIATPLKNSKVFPPVVAYMISVGEESGRLEELLKRVAESYDEEIDFASQRLTAALEPIMIVGMALIVGFVVLAILLPIFQMSNI